MTLTEAIKSGIIQLCEDNNLTINALAENSALAPSTIKNILYGKSKNPRIVLIKMICDSLNMTLTEFFNTDNFNHLEPEIK